MMKVRKLNVVKGIIIDRPSKEDEVYVGRHFQVNNEKLEASLWGNPFKVGTDGLLSEVVKLYEEYLKKNLLLRNKLKELEGKTLFCWCKNIDEKDINFNKISCHAEVIIKVLRELYPDNVKEV